jgi:membrane-bound lytic murein transglycosylase D
MRSIAACLAIALGACGPGALAQSADDPFPRFESIEPNVQFWTRVWGSWSMGQIAVHDVHALGLVYEIVDLPGPIEESYTREQREFIDDVNDRWKDRLHKVERDVADGRTLSDSDKALVLNMTDLAGGNALTGASKRVRSQRGLRERFKRGVEISSRYDTEFRRIFRDAGLPEDLAILPHVESSFQARARSSAGAVGIWQFTRGAGRRYLTISSAIDERLDPVAAAGAAAGYLTDAFARLKDWPIALTSYNHGVAGMGRAVDQHGRDYERIFNEYKGRTFGFASRNFYAEFLAARDLVNHPETFAGSPLNPEPQLDLDSIVLERPAAVTGIAQAYGIPQDQLAALNPAWTQRAVQRGVPLPRNTRVWLPTATVARLQDDGGLPEIPVAPKVQGDGSYVVRRGDTLSHIARAHGMGLRELRDLNDMPAGQGLIRVGQRLRVVDGAVTHHTVRRGDTLSGVASRYRMTTGQLRNLNAMRAGTSLIRAGQKLRVRGDKGSVHVVKRGDTLMHIAANYRVRLSALLALNRLSMKSLIRPGQTIRIPAS